MGRKRKEYVEREADESGTPFERFERALKKVLTTPKRPIPKLPRTPRAAP